MRRKTRIYDDILHPLGLQIRVKSVVLDVFGIARALFADATVVMINIGRLERGLLDILAVLEDFCGLCEFVLNRVDGKGGNEGRHIGIPRESEVHRIYRVEPIGDIPQHDVVDTGS